MFDLEKISGHEYNKNKAATENEEEEEADKQRVKQF